MYVVSCGPYAIIRRDVVVTVAVALVVAATVAVATGVTAVACFCCQGNHQTENG